MQHAIRLRPGEDLLLTLNQWTQSQGIKAGAVVTCVGSLSETHIRLANRDSGSRFHQKMEILALSGTLSPDGAHLHICIADGDGRTIGGHVMQGCHVHTTAEIVLMSLENVSFNRIADPDTGYRELLIS